LFISFLSIFRFQTTVARVYATHWLYWFRWALSFLNLKSFPSSLFNIFSNSNGRIRPKSGMNFLIFFINSKYVSNDIMSPLCLIRLSSFRFRINKIKELIFRVWERLILRTKMLKIMPFIACLMKLWRESSASGSVLSMFVLIAPNDLNWVTVVQEFPVALWPMFDLTREKKFHLLFQIFIKEWRIRLECDLS